MSNGCVERVAAATRVTGLRLMIGLAGAAVACGSAAPAAAAEPAETMTREEVEGIVRDYLLAHPEVIIEALEGYQRRVQAAQVAASREAIAAATDELLDDPDTPIAGNPEGDVALVEFFDYSCPHCRQAAPAVAELLERDPDVRVVYKELPILGPESVRAARAALAADKQGRYRELHEALMSVDGELSEERIFRIAEEIGVDVARLRQDMERPDVDAALRRNLALAQAIGIQGTPAFVIGGELHPGALGLADLEALVAQARGE
jgi:protein-disulfide isomerase